MIMKFIGLIEHALRGSDCELKAMQRTIQKITRLHLNPLIWIERNYSIERGTKLQDDKVLTSGGRVFCATALGKDLQEAQSKAYDLVESVSFDGSFFIEKILAIKGLK